MRITRPHKRAYTTKFLGSSAGGPVFELVSLYRNCRVKYQLLASLQPRIGTWRATHPIEVSEAKLHQSVTSMRVVDIKYII